MIFEYKDYSEEYFEITEALLDEEAIRNTGCDEGFHAFYSYWLEDAETSLNENFWCKLVFGENSLLAVVCIGRSEGGEFIISEIIVSPSQRNKGFGTKILQEVISHSKDIIGARIATAKAVIYPNNISSQRAFEKAGFIYDSAHPDGDALYYKYEK